jgi:hypothetical protein
MVWDKALYVYLRVKSTIDWWMLLLDMIYSRIRVGWTAELSGDCDCYHFIFEMIWFLETTEKHSFFVCMVQMELLW